jgi:hypothetical protein
VDFSLDDLLSGPKPKPKAPQYQVVDSLPTPKYDVVSSLPAVQPRMASDATNQNSDPTGPGYPTLPEAARLAESVPTFGVGSRINALVRHLTNGEPYDAALADEQAKLDVARTKTGAVPIQLAAGLAIPGLGELGDAKALAPEAAQLGRSMLMQGAKSGAVYGALAGAGNARTAPGSAAVDQLLAALKGGAVGAVTGGLTGAAVPAALTGAGAAARSIRNAVVGDDQGATDLIQRRLMQANVDPAGEAARLQQTQKPVMLGDVGGGALANLAGAANATPGVSPELRQVLATRAISRPSRMANDLTVVSGAPSVPMPGYLDQIKARFKPVEDAAWEAARNGPRAITLDPATQSLLGDGPAGEYAQRVFGDAKKVNDLGVQVGRETPIQSPFTTNADLIRQHGLTPELNASLRAHLAAKGDPGEWAAKSVVSSTVDPAAVDRILTGIGDEVQKVSAGPGADKNLAANLMKLKGSLQDALDQQAPLFAQARALTADKYARVRAAELGGDLGKLNRTGEEITAAMQDVDPAHLGDLRAAAAGVIRPRLFGGDISKMIDPAKANGVDDRLTALFGPGAANALRDRTVVESLLQPMERAMGGSRTTPLAADMQEMNGGVSNAVGSTMLGAAAGGGRGVAMGVASKLLKSLSGGMNTNTANQLADQLMAGRGSRQDLLDALDQYAKMQAQQITRAKAAQMAGKSAASVVPGLLFGGS